jgi:hypothetical protein
MCLDICGLCGLADRSRACQPASDPEGICQQVPEICQQGHHGYCRAHECAWMASTGERVKAAATQAIAETGQPLAVVGVDPAGEVVEVRAFQRAQQAKPYRTKIGARIDPDPSPPIDQAERWSRAKTFAFVVCDQGHFV